MVSLFFPNINIILNIILKTNKTVSLFLPNINIILKTNKMVSLFLPNTHDKETYFNYYWNNKYTLPTYCRE